jgi:hypothetical protein
MTGIHQTVSKIYLLKIPSLDVRVVRSMYSHVLL